jgi:hypothetical protein
MKTKTFNAKAQTREDARRSESSRSVWTAPASAALLGGRKSDKPPYPPCVLKAVLKPPQSRRFARFGRQWSDGPNMIPLGEMKKVLGELKKIYEAAK